MKVGGAGTVSGSRSSKCGHFTLCFVVISGQNSKMERSVKGRVPCDLGFMFGSVSVRVLIVRVQGSMCVTSHEEL